MRQDIATGIEGTLDEPTRPETTVEELVLELVPPLETTSKRLDYLSDYALDSLDLARDAIGYAWELLRHGPIYERRVEGQNGKIFTQYKVRTMKKGSEKRVEQSEHPVELEASGKPKGFEEDVLGRTAQYLRKTGIDELPQLINVALRQMNFIGWRPLTSKEERSFPEDYNRHKKRIKPGIGGSAYLDYDNPDDKQRVEGDSRFVYPQLAHPIASQVKGIKIIANKIITRKIKNH